MYDDEADKGKKGKSPQKQTVKLVACGQCEGCKRKACKKCEACTGNPKKRCINRACVNIRRETVKGKGSSNGHKGKGDDGSNDDANGQELPKPRIRLKLSSGKKGTPTEKTTEKKSASAKKRKATPQKTIGNASKRARTSSAKKPSPSSSDESEDDDEDADESMFDVNQLQTEYDNLDGTWEAARDFLVRQGVWSLPSVIESKFEDVAKITLANISK